MQKRIFIFLFLIAAVLSYSTFAEAALQFLPRYQGGHGSRTQTGGKDKVCSASYQYTCSGTGYSGGSGTACGGKYQSCVCAANYKWSGGSCTLKTCADYGYSASKDTTKSCEEKTPRSGLTCYACTSCNTTTYKYSCSGGLNATEQGTDNKCGTSYSECTCVTNASWNSSTGKCECGSDYKAGSTSCSLKTCDDYGYSATEDKTKNCSKQTPRSGLECWNCSDCTGTLYDCGNITNASGGEGTACGGKYPSCSCKSLYRWDNGSCVLNCTRNSCSTTTYPLTAQNAANASSYEKCTPSCSDESPRYKVASCASGYNVNSNASGCDVEDCSKYSIENKYVQYTSNNAYYIDCMNQFGSQANYDTTVDCGGIKYIHCICRQGSTWNSAGTACEVGDPCDSVTAVSVPDNAYCSSYHSSCSSKCVAWACDDGYNKSGDICVETCDEWEDNGSILYTDGSICSNIVTDKVPYAVILDTDRFIAISLHTWIQQTWELEYSDEGECGGVGNFIGDISSQSHGANLARDLEEVSFDDDGLSHTQFAVMHGGYGGVFRGAINETGTNHLSIFGSRWYGYNGSNVTKDADQYDHWWFVPSYTEMSILSANIKYTNQVLTDIKNVYGYGDLLEYGWYWISIQTWGADGYAVRLSPDAGIVSSPAYEYKGACSKHNVRYFIRYDKFRDLAEKYKREQQQ